MEITIDTLQKMLDLAAEHAVAKFINRKGGDSISQRAAYDEFGRVNVRRWELSGRIKPQRQGTGRNSKLRYSHSKLEELRKIESMNVMPSERY